MRSGVHASVYLSHPAAARRYTAGLLLWARRAANIDQLLHSRTRRCGCGWRVRAVPRCQLT